MVGKPRNRQGDNGRYPLDANPKGVGMRVHYNEIDPHVAQCLRNLVAAGKMLEIANADGYFSN